MTQLLEKAFERATALPPDLQDEFGALFIADMEDELRWKELFAQSHDILAHMGQKAIEDFRAGRTSEIGWDKL
jgi:hypothetical protein